jgi:aminoglycoside 6'-N-acetyltransferase
VGHFVALGHHRFTIDPALANERAIRSYAAVGFRPVGAMRAYERGRDGAWHDGAWHDNLVMDLLAEELDPPSRSPAEGEEGDSSGPPGIGGAQVR